eukprot:901730-Pyramimonas_sp.AAC.1
MSNPVLLGAATSACPDVTTASRRGPLEGSQPLPRGPTFVPSRRLMVPGPEASLPRLRGQDNSAATSSL